MFDPENVVFYPKKSYDRNGRVFFSGDDVFRAIHPGRTAFVKDLVNSQVVRAAIEDGHLVRTRWTKHSMRGAGAVLQHEPIEFKARPLEFSALAHLEAAISYLSLYRRLRHEGYMLADGHMNNMTLAPGGCTVWMDFGSIVESSDASLGGLSSFLDWFYYPTKLLARTHSWDLRHRMGVKCPRDQYYAMTSPRVTAGLRRWSQRSDLGGVLLRGFTSEYIRNAGFVRESARLFQARRRGLPYGYRDIAGFLERLTAYFEEKRARYLHSLPRYGHAQPVQRLVIERVEEAQPERLLWIQDGQELMADLSIIEATECAGVTVVGCRDEMAVSSVTHFLGQEGVGRRLIPIVLAEDGVDEDLAERAKADFVVALGTIESLSASRPVSPRYVVDQLIRAAGSSIALTLPNSGELGPDEDRGRKIRTQVTEHFDHVESIPDERGQELLIGHGRRE